MLHKVGTIQLIFDDLRTMTVKHEKKKIMIIAKYLVIVTSDTMINKSATIRSLIDILYFFFEE